MPVLPEYFYRSNSSLEVPKMRSRLYSVGHALALVSAALLLSAYATADLGHASWQDGVTTVFLVRHAEKDTIPEGDPQLTGAGESRAQDLSHVLEEGGVTAIFATQFRRTQDTVRPLADLLGLEVKIVEANRTDQLVETIRRNHQGGVVVVCGHSNTVPEIIVELGAAPVSPIEEANEYDNLYVVRLSADGGAEVTTLKFGRRPQ
jgi:broad specificity phosphatase PhoE